MTANFDSFKLYDTNILNLLYGWPDKILDADQEPEHQGVFEGLREPDLICAIYQKNYSRTYRSLEKLSEPLPPKDAMAACLCALTGTKRLMNRVLDHCPPIPEFQFQGVGAVASLLNVVVQQDRHEMLDILLKRGADPNRGTASPAQTSPLESAFEWRSYLCLQRLLQEPDLEVEWTEKLLSDWGELRERIEDPFDGHSTFHLWNCQLIYERLSGQTVNPFELVPLPEPLRVGHALRCNNMELAIRICRERPLDGEDIAQIRTYLSANCRNRLLEEDSLELLRSECSQQMEFLLQLLQRHPELLETPEIRQAVAAVALALPQPDPRIQAWVERMADGPVQLQNIPIDALFEGDLLAQLLEQMTLEADFFPRWETRLGSRLTPALHRDTRVDGLRKKEFLQLLQRVVFTGAPTPGRLSCVAARALSLAPEERLPELMGQDGLLGQEGADDLLNACQELPLARRNLILPYVRKETDYEL